MTWAMLNGGFAKIAALYSLPRDAKQIALLFSHDADRLALSLQRFSSLVERIKPASLAEVGCGAGYLLQYLRHLHPELRLTAVDRQANLLNAIPDRANISKVSKDYTLIHPEDHLKHDLVICDFGWDNSDLPKSTAPHSKATLCGADYCPGCSDDSIPFFQNLVRSCISWCRENGHIAILGRLQNFGLVRAICLGAEREGLMLSGFEVLQLRYGRQLIELFPSFVLSRSPNVKAVSIEQAAQLYSAALTSKN